MQIFTTVQEACDYSVAQIVKQGRRSASYTKMPVGQCQYFGPNNTRCAIGWLLPEYAEKDINNSNMGLRELLEDYEHTPWMPAIINEDSEELFSTLQTFHDVTSETQRAQIEETLRTNFGIDTSAPHWKQWIALGEESSS